MKQLIVNADDFGYTSGINRAIVQASRSSAEGIITSASLMVNTPAFEEAVALARSTPALDVGCHLNLVEGRPIAPASKVPGLVSPSGEFLGARRLALQLISRRATLEELERECYAQIELLLSHGIQPSHLDTHQHTHLHPRVMSAVVRAAQRFNIQWIRQPFESLGGALQGRLKRRLLGRGLRVLSGGFSGAIRGSGVAHTDHFTGFVQTGTLSLRSLLDTLNRLPTGTTELMCHPGYADSALAGASTKLREQREREFYALRDPKAVEAIREHEIQLVSFRELPVLAPQESVDELAGASKPVLDSCSRVGRVKL
jgi:chitin disaccharide deacetylase